MHDLTGHAAELRCLTRTDPDPRVRHRADALLVLAHRANSGGSGPRHGVLPEADSGLAAPLPGRRADRTGRSPACGTTADVAEHSRGGAGVRLGGFSAGLRLSGDHLDGGRPDRSAHAARLAGQPRDGLASIAIIWCSGMPGALGIARASGGVTPEADIVFQCFRRFELIRGFGD